MCASESVREIKQLPLKLPKKPKTTHNTHARATGRNGDGSRGRGKEPSVFVVCIFPIFQRICSTPSLRAACNFHKPQNEVAQNVQFDFSTAAAAGRKSIIEPSREWVERGLVGWAACLPPQTGNAMQCTHHKIFTEFSQMGNWANGFTFMRSCLAFAIC